MSTVRLFYVEFCLNNSGVWDRDWFATEEAARERYDDLVSYHGVRTDLIGKYGDVCMPQYVLVPLTPEGILHFAQNYAVDNA